jgi:acyl carrier protein
MNRVEIEGTIRRSIVEVEPRLKDVALVGETTLAALGLDSLKVIEVGVRLEDAFGGGVRFDDWLEDERTKPAGNAFSIASLVQFVDLRSSKE